MKIKQLCRERRWNFEILDPSNSGLLFFSQTQHILKPESWFVSSHCIKHFCLCLSPVCSSGCREPEAGPGSDHISAHRSDQQNQSSPSQWTPQTTVSFEGLDRAAKKQNHWETDQNQHHLVQFTWIWFILCTESWTHWSGWSGPEGAAESEQEAQLKPAAATTLCHFPQDGTAGHSLFGSTEHRYSTGLTLACASGLFWPRVGFIFYISVELFTQS